MARKGLVENNQRRLKLAVRDLEKRQELKKQIKAVETIEEKIKLVQKLDDMPRNGSMVRYRRRCAMTGRPRGYNKFTGLSRCASRILILEGKAPGFRKGRTRG